MLDKFDNKILTLLKEDSRESFAEIGREIGLSASSVRERIQRLTDTEVIRKFTIELNQEQLGFELEAFILIKLFSGKLKKFISIVNQFEEVQKSYRVTGNENVLMKVVLKNQKHLQGFLDKIMVFGDTTTLVVLSEIVDSGQQES
jgi:Lrp/AsnC family leucine-responsive transcriptional regulator